jgi:hypothetical protein
MQETQMPTNEQIIRLIDIAMSEKGKDLAYDPTLSPTRSDYTPLITDVLVENMRYQLPEGSRPLTDLIGCVTHYHGVEGVDIAPSPSTRRRCSASTSSDTRTSTRLSRISAIW